MQGRQTQTPIRSSIAPRWIVIRCLHDRKHKNKRYDKWWACCLHTVMSGSRHVSPVGNWRDFLQIYKKQSANILVWYCAFDVVDPDHGFLMHVFSAAPRISAADLFVSNNSQRMGEFALEMEPHSVPKQIARKALPKYWLNFASSDKMKALSDNEPN